MEIIMLIGKRGCCKSLTCQIVYEHLKSLGAEIVKSNNKGINEGDFTCLLRFNGKNIFIKSKGDTKSDVNLALAKAKDVDVLLCASRATFTAEIGNARRITTMNKGSFISIDKETIGVLDACNSIINHLNS